MTESPNVGGALIFLLLNLGASLFKSKSRLEAENAALRHQLIVLQRTQIRELTHAEFDAVSGGLSRIAALIEAYKVIQDHELLLIDVEPVPYVSMKL